MASGFHGETSIVGIGQTEFSKNAGRSETTLACEAIIAALTDAGLDHRRCRRSRQLHHRSGRGDGAGPLARPPRGRLVEPGAVRRGRLAGGRAPRRRRRGVRRGRRGRRLPGTPRTFGERGSARAGQAGGHRDLRTFGYDGHAVVLPLRGADAGVMDGPERDALHAHLRRHERRLRAGGGATSGLCRHQSQRALLRSTPSSWPITRRPDGSRSRASVCSTAVRRPTARPPSWSRPPTGPADTRAPVVIAAAAAAALFEQEIATDHYRPDLAIMDGSVALARRLFGGSGISRDDIDVALVYDAFTPILLMQLEALGFCGLGEAKDFVADGHLGARRDPSPATPTAGSSARATSTASTSLSKRYARSGATP